MDKKISIWLKEGEQTKITKNILKISERFSGNEFQKIWQILDFMSKNLKWEKYHEKVLKIFASRTAEEIINSKIETGCHDTATVLVCLLRAVKIPAKYLFGINKISPHRGGHCVAEAFVNGKWILIDPSFYQINLIPSRSNFYKENFIIKKGLDSWDCGIISHEDWLKASNKLIQKINKLSDNH